MSKRAKTDHPIHDLLANRWSPYGFSSRAVPREEIRSLFEAARWAASSYNEQPWSYVIALKEDAEEFEKALSCLVEGNQVWAQAAPALVICCTNRKFALNGKPNAAAEHDLGLAAGNICVEATARGIAIHQMIGILPDKARAVYNIPDDVDPLTGMAIGYAADPDTLPEKLKQRDESPRTRKLLAEFVFSGSWGTASDVVGGG